jgi:glycosyltransferase involved in cell wall biosynthesis
MSGIGRYLREVLAGVLADARFGRVAVLGRPEEVAPFLQANDPRGIGRTVAFPYAFYDPRVHARWAALSLAGRLRADLAFFPHYDVPLTHGAPPSVVTVQDLSHWRLPELFPAWKRRLGLVVLGRAVRRAARVVVTSGATRRDLLERFPHAERRLEVVPLGVGRDFAERPVDPAALARARALGPYLLCVGNRKPHKNLGAAVEALARLRATHPGLRLVLVGRHFPGEDAVRARAVALGVADAVVEMGEAGEDDLRALYACGECLLFPSLYEGFGLPVLEAMSLGLPVVASDRASIPEVAGGAALIVDPLDAGAIAHAAGRVMREPGLRERLVSDGLRRAGELTWARTAAAVCDLLARTAAAPGASACAD